MNNVLKFFSLKKTDLFESYSQRVWCMLGVHRWKTYLSGIDTCVGFSYSADRCVWCGLTEMSAYSGPLRHFRAAREGIFKNHNPSMNGMTFSDHNGTKRFYPGYSYLKKYLKRNDYSAPLPKLMLKGYKDK